MRLLGNNISASRQVFCDTQAPLPCSLAQTPARLSCSPTLGAGVPGGRTALHNTSQHHVLEVQYPWHPLYGKVVVVRGHLLKQGHELCRCSLPGQEARIGFEIPAWMLDRAFCAGMQLKGEPHVSFGALVALKQLWDEALAPTEVRRQATSKNHEGDAYVHEAKQTTPAPAQPLRSDSPPPSVGGSARNAPSTAHRSPNPNADQSGGSRVATRKSRRGQ